MRPLSVVLASTPQLFSVRVWNSASLEVSGSLSLNFVNLFSCSIELIRSSMFAPFEEKRSYWSKIASSPWAEASCNCKESSFSRKLGVGRLSSGMQATLALTPSSLIHQPSRFDTFPFASRTSTDGTSTYWDGLLPTVPGPTSCIGSAGAVSASVSFPETSQTGALSMSAASHTPVQKRADGWMASSPNSSARAVIRWSWPACSCNCPIANISARRALSRVLSVCRLICADRVSIWISVVIESTRSNTSAINESAMTEANPWWDLPWSSNVRWGYMHASWDSMGIFRSGREQDRFAGVEVSRLVTNELPE